MKKVVLYLLAAVSLLCAQDVFTAQITAENGSGPGYICRNNVVNSFNSRIATHYYMTPRDKILAKEVLDMAVSGEFQSYTFQDESAGKKVRLTAGDAGLQLMILADGEAVKKLLKMPYDMVFNPGLQSYIRSEMQALTAGESRKISFFDPVRAEFVKMILEPVPGEADDGELSVAMRPAGWFGKKRSGIRTFIIEKNSARILQMQGPCVVVPHTAAVKITYNYASPYAEEGKPQKLIDID